MELVKREYEILDDKMREYGGRKLKLGETVLKLTESEAAFGVANGTLRMKGEVEPARAPRRSRK